jgi:hypothetical protein
LHQYRSESSHDGEELLDDVEKSSHVREEAIAVLSILRRDGFGSKSVLEESPHVVFPSRSVAAGSTDVRFEPRA